ncbi:MAG: hypothetical protein ACP5DC_08640 [Halothiobacillaceae bacterium]
MTFRQPLAITLALVVSISLPAGSLLAQDRKTFPGDAFIPGDTFIPSDKFSARTELRAFPGDAFSPQHLRQFKGQGIVTAGDLVSADPKLVGRILKIDPKQARDMQQKLRSNMR